MKQKRRTWQGLNGEFYTLFKMKVLKELLRCLNDFLDCVESFKYNLSLKLAEKKLHNIACLQHYRGTRGGGSNVITLAFVLYILS